MSKVFSRELSDLQSKSGSANLTNLEKDIGTYKERSFQFLRTRAMDAGDENESSPELIPPCPIKFWTSQVSLLHSPITVFKCTLFIMISSLFINLIRYYLGKSRWFPH